MILVGCDHISYVDTTDLDCSYYIKHSLHLNKNGRWKFVELLEGGIKVNSPNPSLQGN